MLALDQSSKAIVRGAIDPGSRHDLLPGVDLVNVRNRGIAFGLLTGNATLLTVLTLVALTLLLAYFARHSDRPLAWLPTGLLLGGALGNMFDRLDRGAVTDFIDVPLWPAFNVSDVAITFGVLSLLYVHRAGLVDVASARCGTLRSPPARRASAWTASWRSAWARAPAPSG